MTEIDIFAEKFKAAREQVRPRTDARSQDRQETPKDRTLDKGRKKDSRSATDNLIVRRASEVELKSLEWIWPGRLALGKLTALAGDPGAGKSTFSTETAAAVTTGRVWPCSEGKAPLGSVIILSAEDAANDTLVPRLMAADADLTRVHFIEAARTDDHLGTRSFSLTTDIQHLEKLIAEIGDVKLVIIDPISSYLGKTDSHKNAEVRGLLEPLSKMAERTGVAVLTITHFSKVGSGTTAKALHRFMGSIAFIAAARIAFAVIASPEDETRRLFLHVKNNLTRPPQGLGYRLNQREIRDGVIASFVVWDTDPVTMTANEALAAEGISDDQRSALVEAEELLRNILRDGPLAAKDAEERARALDIAPRTLRRARKRLGVVVAKDGMDGGWKWSLPLEDGQPGPKVAKENNWPSSENLATFANNTGLK